MGKTIAELRAEIEHVKEQIADKPELVRMMLEDLLSTGICFVHIEKAVLLSAETMLKTEEGYRQIIGVHKTTFEKNEILCLARIE